MKYSQQIIKSLKEGGVGVIPTDTVYGIVCSALNEKSVEKVYGIRRRRPDKPCIILIADISDLSLFGIEIDSPSNQVTKQLINKVTLLFPAPFFIRN
jgi:L-threonylcarbamoyladenylate synthase